MPRRAGLLVELLALLSLAAGPVWAEPFSVKCVWLPYAYLTFDEATGRAVFEVQDASAYAAAIEYSSEDEIRIHLLVNPKATVRTWNRKTGRLTVAGQTDEGNPCVPSELRPIFFQYDRLLGSTWR